MGRKNSKKKKNYNNSENDNTKKYKIKTKSSKKNKKQKGKKKHKILKRLFLTLFLLCFLVGIAGVGIVVGIFTSDKYKVSESDFIFDNENSKVVIADGSTETELAWDERRIPIKLEEMGPYIPNAFIAIEDERFEEHIGIDIKRTLGAAVTFITSGGKSSFGGSTITQQVIKNRYKDDDDSGLDGVKRKIREMARAYNLEKIWSKNQILEYYLNYIYMGGFSKNIMGVEMGARYYFNKSAKDLSLAQSAFLAGINNTPNSYDPFDEEKDNSEKIKKRTEDVIWKMQQLGYIESEEEYNNAIQEVENGLEFSKGNVASNAGYSFHTAAAIDQILKQLVEENDWTYDFAREKLFGGGYTIYTTQDASIQASMKAEFEKDKYIEKGVEKVTDANGNKVLRNPGHTQAGMVIIDQKTGQVVACMGALGKDADPLGLNRATQGTKQPGSSFKPIAVIAPALEKGIITAGTVYDDSKTIFGTNYDPHNSDGYHGLMSIRTALAKSSNIVHIKIMNELGPANSIEFLKTIGIDVDKRHEALSLALGTADVSPLQMGAAYAAIANNGVYIEPTFYTKVEDKNGNVILEPKQESRRVMSEENAYILQELLTAPARSGTAAVCYMSYMDTAAKTGSTNGYKDRWLCGFTPYYTAATWFGFDNTERPASGANHAANIWAAVMKPLHKNLPTARFQKPNNNVISAKICLDSGMSATESCTRTTTELFVKGTVPKACEGHPKLKICKETGKIANEYCTDVEEKTFLVKPEKENTTLWKTDAGNKYDIPTETCDVHKKPEIKQVEVPNVVGNTLEVAKKKLEDLKLKVLIQYSEDTTKNDNVVLKQSVSVGTKVNEGTSITLTINKKSSSGGENTGGSSGGNTVENNVNTNTTVNEIT